MSLYDAGLIESFMGKKGFRIERMKKIEGAPVEPVLYGFREGHSLWKFFPFEDHFFFYDFNDAGVNNSGNLLACHNAAREWVDKRLRYPKWMRYKVPNIVTVVFSAGGFSEDMKKAVSEHAPYGVGGEKHSMHLIDTSAKKYYSAGIESTRASAVSSGAAASVTIAPANVNPNNRAYHLIKDMLKDIFQFNK
jgi:hypothetical protein